MTNRGVVRLFDTRVGARLQPGPPSIAADTSCRAAGEMMRARGARRLHVVGSAGRLLGVLSAADLVTRLVAGAAEQTPVRAVMSHPAHSVGVDETLLAGLARMRRHNLRQIPVLDPSGRPLGVLDWRGLWEEGAAGLGSLLEATDVADGAGLREAKIRQVDLADALLSAGLSAPQVMGCLSCLNDAIYRRIVQQGIEAMEEQGWGLPPVRFAVLVMGSGGRHESLLRPDQDNGFLLADYPDRDFQPVAGYFHELARRMTGRLDAVGFPLCKGYVMATNPSWCKRLGEWQSQLRNWLARASHAATVLTDILIDFRHVCGDERLTESLRAYAETALPRHPGFLRELEQLQFDRDVAITPFRTLKLEHLPGQEGDRQVDIKRKGILALVEGTRILALRAGIRAPDTLGRLAALRAGGHLDELLAERVEWAFGFLAELLLRRQIQAVRAGRQPDAYVPPTELGRLQRRQLKLALSTAARLRAMVHAEFTAELF